ncbi:sugar ABC transporter ATP-binding protein [Candidatus Aerophobetes bacterium]|nr:sugar ABC transporter ATP-binding protein [Candidatus Aerophobetes bacterium]
MRENSYVVEMKNIYKSFGGIQALIDVNLELKYGEILGLVGDNAAGKSTLMKILTGVYQADRGRIFFEGREVHIVSPRISRQLGIEMVYQDFKLCPNLDIPANLFLGREITSNFFKTLKNRQMESMAVEILSRLKIGIKNFKIKTSRLSGGQQQSVAIAKAASFNPKVVVMDEPTASLAVVEIRKVLDLILYLKEQGLSIILITHRLDDIFEVSDRIFVLKHGRRVTIKETSQTNKDEIIKLMF